MTKIDLRFTGIILFLICLSVPPTSSQGQNLTSARLKSYNDQALKIVRTALTEKKGYEWLKELCGIGPRLSGSEKSLKAIYWAEKKMKSLGFDSVWLQPVMVPHWSRGKIENASVSYSKKFKNRKLTVVSLGGSVGTPLKGISAEIIEVQSLEEVKTLGERARGKIIFFNRSFDNGLLSTFEGYGKAVDQRGNGAIEAAKAGAVAALVRSVQSGYDNVPHTGVMNYQDGVQKIPAAAIGIADADFLSKALKDEPGLKVRLRMDCENLPEIQSYNLIGEIKGSEFKDEVIVAGGHFDSWDKGCGAHDDGAPCIQTFEALDLIKRTGLKPKRTIRSVLFINEENGLRGGIEYGRYSESTSEKHIAAIESDRGAFTPRGFNVTTDSLTFLKMQQWVPILNRSGIDWIRKGGSGGDVAQIKNAKALLGYVPDDQRYMDLHHSANDIFAAVNPREMELGSAAIAIMLWMISEEGL